jgi:hypothetical protein
MRRRHKAGGKGVKTPRRKTLTRGPAPKSARRRSSLAAGKETNVARLTRELKEAREQQTATAEVLGAISCSPGELEPVFSAILANATRICEAKFANLFLYEDNSFRIAAQQNAPPQMLRFEGISVPRRKVDIGLALINYSRTRRAARCCVRISCTAWN